jgi:orotate phosphoribosyltransferase
MDETTRVLIERITVRHASPQPLPDGRRSDVFFDCALLSPNDLSRLAALAVGDLGEEGFDAVVGIAYSGILFAAAVAGGKQVLILKHDGTMWGTSPHGLRVLVVDDIIYTRRHAREAAARVTALGATVVGAVCIIDRAEDDSSVGETIPVYSAFQVRSSRAEVE